MPLPGFGQKFLGSAHPAALRLEVNLDFGARHEDTAIQATRWVIGLACVLGIGTAH